MCDEFDHTKFGKNIKIFLYYMYFYMFHSLSLSLSFSLSLCVCVCVHVCLYSLCKLFSIAVAQINENHLSTEVMCTKMELLSIVVHTSKEAIFIYSFQHWMNANSSLLWMTSSPPQTHEKHCQGLNLDSKIQQSWKLFITDVAFVFFGCTWLVGKL